MHESIIVTASVSTYLNLRQVTRNLLRLACLMLDLRRAAVNVGDPSDTGRRRSTAGRQVSPVREVTASVNLAIAVCGRSRLCPARG